MTEKIDFAGFNKPPYLPMWLCPGDMLRLAEYDDAQFEELDRNIRDMSGQFGIDSATGAELDRIGKILGEERGGNTDRVYRIYLKLRTMLNTADGTVEDIIKFVKFFFSSETVHLVPNYPAGLRILHDGFNDTVDFNRIIKQIVGAGIAYDTRELFNMADEMPFSDEDEMCASRSDTEYFARNMVLRDGRVLRDGVTVLPTHLVPYQYEYLLLRNGSLLREGTERRCESVVRDGLRREKTDAFVSTPVLRNSGIIDLLSFVYVRSMDDEWKSRLFRNGAVRRDGSERRSGSSVSSMNDALFFDGASHRFSDRIVISESDGKKAVTKAADGIGRDYRRNASIPRDGRAYRASDRLADSMPCIPMRSGILEEWTESERLSLDSIGQRSVDAFPVSDRSEEGTLCSSLSDGIGRGYRRNGTLRRGVEAYRSSGGIADPLLMSGASAATVDRWSVSDSFASGRRWWFFRSGQYNRNGGMVRKSGVLEEYEQKEA